MDHGARNRGRQDTLAELVERTSLQAPRLIIVEDVHWADGPTLGHLARLAQAVGVARAVLVTTSRLEGDPLDHVWRSSAGDSPLLTLDLGPLRDDEASILAHAYVDASAELARRCVARAAGNPLFLDQLLRHAEESAEDGIPGSVQSLVQARLDHLQPADRQALQAASVLGQRFTADALGHLLGQPTHDCSSLVRHLLVRMIGDELLFAHALIRDGVYDSLLRSRRAALHLRAAEWFATHDPALHAEHLDLAQDPGAPDAYLEAARGQAAAYRYDAALALAERGLAIARTGQQTFALTCLRGDILHDLGAMAVARDAYGAALAAASDDAQRCRAWLGLAAVKRVTDDLDGAFADLDRAEVAAQAHDLKEQLARIHFLRGNLHFPRGNLEGCLEQHGKSLALAQATGAADLEAAALGGLGDAEYVRGRMLTARRYFERCIEISRQHGFGRIEVTSLPMAAITRFYVGELAETYADALAAVQAAEQVGHHRAAMIGCHIVYLAGKARREAAIGRQHVDRALDLSRQLGARRFEAEALLFQGEILEADGRRAEALATIRRALEISRETGMAYIGPAILGVLARTTDDPEERHAALAEGEQLLASGLISHNYFWFYHDAIETSLEQRDWDGVERYAQALADYTCSEPLPFVALVIACGRALAAFGRNPHHPDAARDLEHARRRAEELGWLAGLPALDAALAATATVASR
jgi:tetratricopeptide (TPR) repeat protein